MEALLKTELLKELQLKEIDSKWIDFDKFVCNEAMHVSCVVGVNKAESLLCIDKPSYYFSSLPDPYPQSEKSLIKNLNFLKAIRDSNGGCILDQHKNKYNKPKMVDHKDRNYWISLFLFSLSGNKEDLAWIEHDKCVIKESLRFSYTNDQYFCYFYVFKQDNSFKINEFMCYHPKMQLPSQVDKVQKVKKSIKDIENQLSEMANKSLRKTSDKSEACEFKR